VAPTKRLHPVVLPDGRVILSIADTIYMLDAEGSQLWKFGTASANETLTSEPAFNATRNEVAVIGNDLLFVRLDATTGKVKWKADTVRRAAFASVTAYESGFLVVADMGGYRRNSTPTSDRLEYWGSSEEDFWSIAFPLNAELVVTGKKIYALRTGAGTLRVQELHPPKAARIHAEGLPHQN
jgi:PQQ-like domain